MGEETPPTYPKIEATKWYCVTTTVWDAILGPCGDVFISTQTCCILGSDLQAIIDAYGYCWLGAGMCVAPTFSYESLDDIKAGYVDAVTCVGNCP